LSGPAGAHSVPQTQESERRGRGMKKGREGKRGAEMERGDKEKDREKRSDIMWAGREG